MKENIEKKTGVQRAIGIRQNMRHDSAYKHVSGGALYIDDMPELAGTLHAAILGSTSAHARIISIDTTKASALDGVHAVLTAQDIKGINDVAPILSDEEVLASKTVEYVGHPLAIVAAQSLAIAKKARELIEVEYATLPATLDVRSALAKRQFVSDTQTLTQGDSKAALQNAVHKIAGELDIGGQDHFYLEGQIALSVPHEGREILVYSSTQHPTEVQHAVARLLGVPHNAVTVEVRRMGGAFGGKESQATIIAGLAAILAEHTRRPVKLRLSRDDDMTMTGKRHDFLVRYEAGFDQNGRITAVEIDYAARCGHVADLSPPVITRALTHADNAYFLPAATFRGYACKTNTVSNTAFRGFGGPQGMLGIEAVIEHIAYTLGKSSDDIRRVNYYSDNGRDTTPYGQTVEHEALHDVVHKLEASADYHARMASCREFNATNSVLKKGIALMPVKFGISFNLPTLNQAGALVHVYTDGSVHLNHGGTEMGQGLLVKVAQVVSEVFSIDLDAVKVSATTTDKVPNTSATAASSGSDLNGMAAFEAAKTIRARMSEVAAGHFGTVAENVVFRDNLVRAGNETMGFDELAQRCWEERVSLSATGFYRTPKIHFDAKTLKGRPFFYFTYGAAVSEVVIDTLTGESRVLRSDLLQDCGQSLNEAIDLGQIEGAFVQGMGWLTCEELWWDEAGRLRTHGPSTYKIPGSRDIPQDMRVHLLEDRPNTEPTIFRSKAVGEPPLMLAISVWLAIRNAVASLADYTLMPQLGTPATPERILFAVDDIQDRSEARS